MLIIFGGLPGTGKTTIAKLLSAKLKTTYLRIDTIEQILKKDDNSIGPDGYKIAYALAKENLDLGIDVIADSVNSIKETREAWKNVALDSKHFYVEIELICSNLNEHQRRVELRKPDIKNQKLPTWDDVLKRNYEPWQSKQLVIDTSKHSVLESVDIILDFIKLKTSHSKNDEAL